MFKTVGMDKQFVNQSYLSVDATNTHFICIQMFCAACNDLDHTAEIKPPLCFYEKQYHNPFT